MILRRAWPPLLVAFLLLAAWIALLAIPGAFLIAMLLALELLRSETALSISALVLAAALILLFWRHHWISGVAMVAGLTIALVLACEPSLSTSPAQWTAGLARIVYYRSNLLRQAEELRKQGLSPTVACIVVDGFGSMTSGVALDPSGEILLPAEKRSQAWVATGGKTELAVEDMEAHHVIGDYYVWFHD